MDAQLGRSWMWHEKNYRTMLSLEILLFFHVLQTTEQQDNSFAGDSMENLKLFQ